MTGLGTYARFLPATRRTTTTALFFFFFFFFSFFFFFFYFFFFLLLLLLSFFISFFPLYRPAKRDGQYKTRYCHYTAKFH